LNYFSGCLDIRKKRPG